MFIHLIHMKHPDLCFFPFSLEKKLMVVREGYILHYGKRRILKIVGSGTGRDAGRNRRSAQCCSVCTDNVSESLILVFYCFIYFYSFYT